MSIIMLADNGSVRAPATLQLRSLAKSLSEETHKEIVPVSLKHADRIPLEKIDGKAARVFNEFMIEQLSAGEREFLLLPLFFGESKALTSFIPDELHLLEEKFGAFKFEIAPVIYPLPEGDSQLASIVHDHLISTTKNNDHSMANIVLVDHGSPIPRITAVRQHIAQAVQSKLPEGITLEEAVMERREGKEYDFNGSLLTDWLLAKACAGETHASVILMFFLPGRHAGVGGDIADICNAVMEKYPNFKIAISPLIAEHPKLLTILANRLQSTFIQKGQK